MPNSPAAALTSLTERLRNLQTAEPPVVPVEVEDVASAVLRSMDGRLLPKEAELLQEVAGLGRIIEAARASIAEISLEDIRGRQIPTATDELAAIVDHTATATNNILEACEVLDQMAEKLERADADALQNATMRIYEACSFQDITGQRITKVVKALQAIEARVTELGNRYGHVAAAGASALPPQAATLLNGPGLPQNAMGQDAIDALLADFD
jgi:chemotaxis protein CheZ